MPIHNESYIWRPKAQLSIPQTPHQLRPLAPNPLEKLCDGVAEADALIRTFHRLKKFAAWR